MSKPKEQLFCYLRVSTDKQLEEGNSIENQRFLGKKISKEKGMEYVELLEGSSSSMIGSVDELMESNRPKFQEMKEGIRIGRIKNLWYYSRSRYCRDISEDLIVRKFFFQKYKVNIFEGEYGKPRTYGSSQERLMDSMISLIQENYKDSNREVSVQGKKHKSRSEGKNSPFMGGTINFGYQNVDKTWKVHKEESIWVKKLFELYLKDTPLKDIKTLFDTTGIPKGIKPRRGKFWSMGTLLTMLKNRVYIGEYSWKDKESGEVFPIVVPKIVTHSVFNRVQKKIEHKNKNKGSNFRTSHSLLGDLLVCYCGENIVSHMRKTVDKNIYICSSKQNGWKGKNVKECLNRRSLNMEQTDKFVTDSILEVVSNSSQLKEDFKKDVLNQKKEQGSEIEVSKKKIERRIRDIDSDIEQTLKSISTVQFNLLQKQGDERVNKNLSERLNEHLGEIEDRKNEYIQRIDDLDNEKRWVDWVGRYGDSITSSFDKPSYEFLKGFIKEIEVSPNFGENRDGVKKQIGFNLDVKFSQPIVNDSIEYINPKNKSKGYNVLKGKTKKNIGTIEVNVGGRGKKKVV